MAPWIIPAITAVGSGLAGLFSQRGANKRNEKLAEKQAGWNKEQWRRQAAEDERRWHMTNAYNSPVEQMARLKQAGLNPAMLYGGGSAVATSAPFANAKEVKGYDRASSESVLRGVDVMGQYTNMRAMQSQLETAKAQRDVMNQDVIKKSFETLDRAVGIQRKSFDLGLAKELRSTNIQAAQANANAAVENAKKGRLDNMYGLATLEDRISKTGSDSKLARLAIDQKKMENAYLSDSYRDRVTKVRTEVAHMLERIKNLSLQSQGQVVLNSLRSHEDALNEVGLQKHDGVLYRIIRQMAPQLWDYMLKNDLTNQ